MFILSDAAKIALLSAQPTVGTKLIASTISFGDGTGTGGRDQILDSGNGLAVFAIQDFILVINGTNSGKFVRALSVAAGAIEVEAGSFTTASSGTSVCLVVISSGSLAQVFKNLSIDIYTGLRPSNAPLVPTGTKLLTLSKDGAAFVAGASANGMNFGEMTGTLMSRAIDPVTGNAEVWRGVGLVAGTSTPGWGRVWANDKNTIFMDGVVEVSGGDINLSTGKSITGGVYSELTNIRVSITGSALVV